MRRAGAALTLVVSALVCSAAAARAEPQARLERLFPSEAEIRVSGSGLARLVLPADVLSACKADLSDVRVFDDDEREVPFLVDGGAAAGTQLRETTTVPAQVLDLERAQTPREHQPPHSEETYRLAAPPAGGSWDLVVDTRRTGFVRALRVTDADGMPLVARAPLVRLGDPTVDRMRVALPVVPGSEIAVHIAGDEGFFLEPTFHFERSRAVAGTGQVMVPLSDLQPARAAGRTVVGVPRPAGIVPELLRLGTTTPVFDRRVQVWDVRPGAPDVRIGDGRVLRVATSTDTVEQVEVTLAPASGSHLRIEIADGDSPSLAGLSLAAVARQPTLIFALPGGDGGEATGTLRFGGGRAHRPRYDLGDLPGVGERLSGLGADVAARLYDPARLPEATLGPVRANPLFDAAPALAFAMRPGAPLDTRRWAYRRTFEAPPSPDGLVRLVLAPEDVARARSDLADLRVVDPEGRQWPFLLDRAVPPARLALAPGPPVRRGRASHLPLALPTAPLPLTRVELAIDAPFFHRAYRLSGTDAEGEAIALASGELIRDAQRGEQVAIGFRPTRVTALELVVDDGDDAPLPVTGAVAEVPVAALLVAAPAGPYALLSGDPEADAPRYELAKVSAVAMALRAEPVRAAPSEANPAFSRAARMAAGEGPQRLVVWLVLGAAVLVLGVLTLRAARQS